MLEVSVIMILVTVGTILYFNHLNEEHKKRMKKIYGKYGDEKWDSMLEIL